MAACDPSTPHQQEMETQKNKAEIIEITTFYLNQGVTPKDFEESARAMQRGFLEKQYGFIKRTLTVSQDSIWTDIVFWKDQQSAEKTMQLSETSEIVTPFMEKIDFNSVKMTLTRPVILE